MDSMLPLRSTQIQTLSTQIHETVFPALPLVMNIVMRLMMQTCLTLIHNKYLATFTLSGKSSCHEWFRYTRHFYIQLFIDIHAVLHILLCSISPISILIKQLSPTIIVMHIVMSSLSPSCSNTELSMACPSSRT
jgi:hypothetical protein